MAGGVAIAGASMEGARRYLNRVLLSVFEKRLDAFPREADDIVEALFTAFTSDDKRLVGITAHNLYVWDATTGTLQSDTSLFDLEEAEDLYYTDEALRDFLKRVDIQIPDVPALARLQDAPLLEIAKPCVKSAES